MSVSKTLIQKHLPKNGSNKGIQSFFCRSFPFLMRSILQFVTNKLFYLSSLLCTFWIINIHIYTAIRRKRVQYYQIRQKWWLCIFIKDILTPTTRIGPEGRRIYHSVRLGEREVESERIVLLTFPPSTPSPSPPPLHPPWFQQIINQHW